MWRQRRPRGEGGLALNAIRGMLTVDSPTRRTLLRVSVQVALLAPGMGCVAARTTALHPSSLAALPNGAELEVRLCAPTRLVAHTRANEQQTLADAVVLTGRLAAGASDSLALADARVRLQSGMQSGPHQRVFIALADQCQMRRRQLDVPRTVLLNAVVLGGIAWLVAEVLGEVGPEEVLRPAMQPR